MTARGLDSLGIFTDFAAMNGIEQLLAVADAYRRATGLDDTRLSWRVFGDSKKLSAIRNDNRDIQVRRHEKAMRWFSENWPEGAVWPAGVPRPASAEAA